MRKPTESQRQLILYFAGAHKPWVKTTRQTYTRCEAEGWIEPTDYFPFHKATEAGRRAVGMEDVDTEFSYKTWDGRIHRVWASQGHVFVRDESAEYLTYGKHSDKDAAIDTVNEIRRRTMDRQHAEALETDRDRGMVYRSQNSDGTIRERTLFVQGNRIMESVDGSAPRVFGTYVRSETAMEILRRTRRNLLTASHVSALTENDVREFIRKKESIRSEATQWLRKISGHSTPKQ